MNKKVRSVRSIILIAQQQSGKFVRTASPQKFKFNVRVSEESPSKWGQVINKILHFWKLINMWSLTKRRHLHCHSFLFLRVTCRGFDLLLRDFWGFPFRVVMSKARVNLKRIFSRLLLSSVVVFFGLCEISLNFSGN